MRFDCARPRKEASGKSITRAKVPRNPYSDQDVREGAVREMKKIM